MSGRGSGRSPIEGFPAFYSLGPVLFEPRLCVHAMPSLNTVTHGWEALGAVSMDEMKINVLCNERIMPRLGLMFIKYPGIC